MTIDPPARWGERDQKHVDQLYQKEFAPLVEFVMAVRDLSLSQAEDVAQEAFIRLMRHPPRDWKKGRSWLRTAAVRLAADAVLSLERHRQKAERWREAEGPSLATSAESQFFSAFDRNAVREALDGLSDNEGRALKLRYSGYSYREIARDLNLDEKQMGVFLLRAMTKLRRRYAEGTKPLANTEGGF